MPKQNLVFYKTNKHFKINVDIGTVRNYIFLHDCHFLPLQTEEIYRDYLPITNGNCTSY